MAAIDRIFLFALSDLGRIDILIWYVSVPILLAGVVLLWYQRREYTTLKSELSQLAQVKRHAIEYDLVMKAMKVGVWRIDVPTNTITYESDYREADNLQLPPGSAVSVFTETLLPEYRKKMARAMDDLLAGRIEELHEQYEMRLPHSGRTGWGECYATVEKRDLEGHPLVVVGASMRIDRQKNVERALIDARNQAEESDRLKSAFLANMSHEIRTPLNAIVGFSDVLPMAQSEEERQELVGLIKKNNAHLLRLFDDMVNMSKLEAGGEAVQKSRFDLMALLAEVAGRYAEPAQEKGLLLQVDDALPAGVQAYTDRDRLAEVVSKYVDNALKFTATGTVTLGFRTEAGRLRVWVRDTGKGIPADRCNEQLFERFVKVDEFVPGTGLGLSICRSLALSLGGTVGVESVFGEGSLFWVDIPLD